MNSQASRISNELGGRGSGAILSALMSPKMIISLVLIGIFSFAALVTLSGYAGDLRQKNNGQAHALSRSAIGYGGLVRLLGDIGYEVGMARTENVSADQENTLRVFTLSRAYQADALDDMNLYAPTLIIMPKWITAPVKGNAGWVQKGWGDSTIDVSNHERDLKELTGEITFSAVESDDKSLTYDLEGQYESMSILRGAEIENLQTIKGDNLDVLYKTAEGPVLVNIIDSSIYILSDPDLLNTMGIGTKTRARFAVDMIDAIIANENADPGRVDFDLTLHGFGGKTNIIKVMTRPPFLAATLCLLAAGALIAWQAFARFGDARATPRDYALGKFSLADNAARFIRIAGREPNMADDYAILVRRQVIKALNLQARKPKDIETILRRREKALGLHDGWVDMHNRARNTVDNMALMRLAQDLDNWKAKMALGDKR